MWNEKKKSFSLVVVTCGTFILAALTSPSSEFAKNRRNGQISNASVTSLSSAGNQTTSNVLSVEEITVINKVLNSSNITKRSPQFRITPQLPAKVLQSVYPAICEETRASSHHIDKFKTCLKVNHVLKRTARDCITEEDRKKYDYNVPAESSLSIDPQVASTSIRGNVNSRGQRRAEGHDKRIMIFGSGIPGDTLKELIMKGAITPSSITSPTTLLNADISSTAGPRFLNVIREKFRADCATVVKVVDWCARQVFDERDAERAANFLIEATAKFFQKKVQ